MGAFLSFFWLFCPVLPGVWFISRACNQRGVGLQAVDRAGHPSETTSNRAFAFSSGRAYVVDPTEVPNGNCRLDVLAVLGPAGKSPAVAEFLISNEATFSIKGDAIMKLRRIFLDIGAIGVSSCWYLFKRGSVQVCAVRDSSRAAPAIASTPQCRILAIIDCRKIRNFWHFGAC
jgi:hypothetical protein